MSHSIAKLPVGTISKRHVLSPQNIYKCKAPQGIVSFKNGAGVGTRGTWPD